MKLVNNLSELITEIAAISDMTDSIKKKKRSINLLRW